MYLALRLEATRTREHATFLAKFSSRKYVVMSLDSTRLNFTNPTQQEEVKYDLRRSLVKTDIWPNNHRFELNVSGDGAQFERKTVP